GPRGNGIVLMINEQPTYIVLDPVIGWQSSLEHLSPVSSGGLAVDCVPGQPTPFAESLKDKLTGAVALAVDPSYRRFYVLDGKAQRIQKIDLALQQQATTQKCNTQYEDDPKARPKPQPVHCGDLEFSVIAGIGGKGRGTRQLRSARGLAVLSDG